MALVKATLVAALIDAGFKDTAANALATAIDAYIKTGTVNTTGTAAAQTGSII